MNYHNITKDDMLNGDGLRVVLWVAGCEHGCPGCQNPETHDPKGGILFDDAALDELLDALSASYISGLTFSGGDPLYIENRKEVEYIAQLVKERYPSKTIWLYTGYLFEHIKDMSILRYIDVLVDGQFILDLKDNNLEWCGSSNQRIIDVKNSLDYNQIMLK